MSDYLERPIEGPLGNARFGSDIVAETLRALDIPYIALNPGASYRGCCCVCMRKPPSRSARAMPK